MSNFEKIFTARIPQDTLNAILTAFFKDMGFIGSEVTLKIDSLEFDDEDVEISAVYEEETVN